MSTSDRPNEMLNGLEEYLDAGPTGDYQRLRGATESLGEGESEDGLAVVQLLGTAVGKQHGWQNPFRENGILRHVLSSLDPARVPTAMIKQYLRVVGNCVADNDENRELVVEKLEKIVACLAEEELTATALAVLFNLFNDFEPAHIEAAKLRLDDSLASYLAAGKIPEQGVDYATELMHLTTEKLTPIQLEDSTSLHVFENILKVSLPYDEDHYQEYLTILVHYLQDPEFQQKIATADTMERLVDLMLDFEVRLSAEESQAVFRELATQADPNKIASEETDVILMVRLASSLAAISASDAFVRNLKLRSPLVKKIKSKLLSLATSPSTVCACVILGNLATSDQVCIDMVEDMGLHITLIEILSSRRELALLYAAAGFMRHLAFPEVNRSILGEAGLIETCSHLFTNKDPSVRGEAAAILCKLISNNFLNIEKVVYESIPEGIVPAQIAGIEAPVHPTILYHLVTQALAPSAPLPSTAMKNPMIELGRTIIAILRYLRQPKAEEDIDAVARHMFKTPAIARPLARLVRQRFYADARSEGLLGLGLMAQSHEGAICVVEEIKADHGLLEAIKEFAVEQKGGQESNATAGRDYQNAVVLLHGLATNGVGAMDASLKSSVESLQAELSRLMI
ncbi:ARM repeat-containing protein [Lentithecium fluviatile CBS 122367]|uniref:ARM repeat-containing protein n=1 Tax=Lentithecium fluviatile CBS 122367 TaxID=1168545 RepID=A0A6G1JA07_9PLEO|nr:ARM repeat-containing protein [Lentithecium fluviatile CBS 122367]